MKYIMNLTDELLLPRGMTIGMKNSKTPIANDEILEWEEIKQLLSQGKIKIIDSDSESPGSSNSSLS